MATKSQKPPSIRDSRNYKTIQLPANMLAPLQKLVDEQYAGIRSITEAVAYCIHEFVILHKLE